MPFYDVTVMPVPTDRKDAHVDHSIRVAALFREHGATAVTDCWGAEVPDGKVTDFKKAVALEEDETVAVGWITWPDKATRDAGWEALMKDPRMADMAPAFNGKRMIYAGFEGIAGG